MVLDTTACQRVKVKAMSVCRGPDRGQKVSVRVKTPGDPESGLTVVCCIHVFLDFALPSMWLPYFSEGGGESDSVWCPGDAWPSLTAKITYLTLLYNLDDIANVMSIAYKQDFKLIMCFRTLPQKKFALLL